MAWTHGVLNAVGYAFCGVVGWLLVDQDREGTAGRDQFTVIDVDVMGRLITPQDYANAFEGSLPLSRIAGVSSAGPPKERRWTPSCTRTT